MKKPFWCITTLFAVAAIAGVGTGLAARAAGAPHTAGPITAGDSAIVERFAAGHLENSIRLAADDRREIDLSQPDPTVRFHLKNQFSGDATVRYATEVADELGNEIIEPVASERIEMEAGAETSCDIPIPSQLLDESGFYLFRITAVGRSGDGVADHSLEIPVAVIDGTAHLINAEQWLEFSLANVGEER